MRRKIAPDRRRTAILSGMGLLTALLLTFGKADSLWAALEPSQLSIITTNYYVFGGTNQVQLREAMIEARPWKQTMTFDAHTKWDIRSTYHLTRTNGQFRLSRSEVKTKVDITLPRWIPGKPVSRELVAQWQKCFNGLTVHEQGHLQLALATAAEVRRRLQELPLFDSPRELTAAAERSLNETVEEFRSRERKYDEVTRHGQTQGAVFRIEIREEPESSVASTHTNGFPRRQNMRRQ